MRILGSGNDEGKEGDTHDRERRRNDKKHTGNNQGGWQQTQALLPVHWELENAMLDDVEPYATPPLCDAQHSLESWYGARRRLVVVHADPWSAQ